MISLSVFRTLYIPEGDADDPPVGLDVDDLVVELD